MPVYYSAGVYVVEKDLSQVVPTTSTSVGAIVLHAKKGQIGKPVLVTNTQEYISNFGNPHPTNGYGAYAALAFLERSSQLYVVRVVEGAYAYSGIKCGANVSAGRPTVTVLGGASGGTNPEGISLGSISTPAFAVTAVSGGSLTTGTTYFYKVTAVNAYGQETTAGTGISITATTPNLTASVAITRVEGAVSYRVYGRPNVIGGTYELIGTVAQPVSGNATFADDGTVTPQTGVIPPVTATISTDAFFVYCIGPGVYGDTYSISILSDNLSTPSISTAVGGTGGVLAAGPYYYRVTAVNSRGQETDAATGTLATIASLGEKVTITINRVEGASYYKVYGRPATVGGTYTFLTSVEQPSSGNATFVDDGSITGTVATIPAANFAVTDEFTISVYDTAQSSSVPVEQYTVTLNEKLDGFGQQMEIETRVNTFSKLIRVVKNDAYTNGAYGFLSVATTAMSGGADGDAYSSISAGAFTAGWDLFADPENITVRLLIEGGTQNAAIQLKMNSLAQSRKDCVAILDMPTAYQEVTQAVVYRRDVLNLNSNRAAIYTPDLRINDPYNDLVIYVPPSGHVAGVYAFTDFSSQVWYAPAGLNRGLLNVLGVRYKYNQAQRDVLAPSQINYVRNFPGLGIAVWEQTTLQSKTSALSFMNVRRMLDIIEVSVSQALLYSNYEPNDDFLKRQIVTLISQFLEVIKGGRGIADYAVISDSSNNPPQIANQGQLNVDVYIQPILPARIIQLQMIITKQGVSFQELIAQGGNV